MNLITKKDFINTVNEVKEFYFIGCVSPDEYSLERLKEIIDGATHEQLTQDKRRLAKINDYQMVSITNRGSHSHLQFKPFAKYYKDGSVFYIVEEDSILVYFIDKE